MKFGGNELGAIPAEWVQRPTDDEIQAYYDVKFRLTACDLAARLNQEIFDGERFEMDKAGFEELASEMDDQIDDNGCCYIGDWLSETMMENDYYTEEW